MDANQRELLRHVVLEILADRHPAALPPPAIRRRAAPELDGPITDADLMSALEVLLGLGHVTREIDPMGSTVYWQATSAGVLAHERGGAR